MSTTIGYTLPWHQPVKGDIIGFNEQTKHAEYNKPYIEPLYIVLKSYSNGTVDIIPWNWFNNSNTTIHGPTWFTTADQNGYWHVFYPDLGTSSLPFERFGEVQDSDQTKWWYFYASPLSSGSMLSDSETALQNAPFYSALQSVSLPSQQAYANNFTPKTYSNDYTVYRDTITKQHLYSTNFMCGNAQSAKWRPMTVLDLISYGGSTVINNKRFRKLCQYDNLYFCDGGFVSTNYGSQADTVFAINYLSYDTYYGFGNPLQPYFTPVFKIDLRKCNWHLFRTNSGPYNKVIN